MGKTIQIAVDFPVGAKTQDVAWRTPDWYVDDLGKFRANVVIDTNARVQYTIDGGNNWFLINSGEKLKSGCSYGFDIYVRAGDLINLNTPDTGVAVLLARLDSVKDEG
jgi:hypothetical protein